MKFASIFLAAVMIFALAGQAAEARDHDGWRHHRHHRSWNNNNWNRWNRGNHYGWRNHNRRYHAWNNRSWNNNWDTNRNGRFDRQDRKRLNRYMNSRWY